MWQTQEGLVLNKLCQIRGQESVAARLSISCPNMLVPRERGAADASHMYCDLCVACCNDITDVCCT